MFLNILPTLQRLFKKNAIVLIPTINYANAKPNFIKYEPFVSMADEIIEGNFRMIESYLPELLYLLSSGDEDKCISTLISRLANEGFPYSDVQLSQHYLQHKVICLLEAMLFADIFGRVWSGDIATHKIYVYRRGSELSYYNYYEVRILLRELLHHVTIHCVKSESNDCVKHVRFSIVQKMQ